MWKIAFILAVISATSRGQSGSGGDILLSCDHPLRVLHPEQFTHCSSCFYGTWSEWSRIGHSVSSSRCNSSYAYEVERTRKDNNGNCQDETEQEYQCKFYSPDYMLLTFCIYHLQVSQRQMKRQQFLLKHLD